MQALNCLMNTVLSAAGKVSICPSNRDSYMHYLIAAGEKCQRHTGR
jgi:hypothetical protein